MLLLSSYYYCSYYLVVTILLLPSCNYYLVTITILLMLYCYYYHVATFLVLLCFTILLQSCYHYLFSLIESRMTLTIAELITDILDLDNEKKRFTFLIFVFPGYILDVSGFILLSCNWFPFKCIINLQYWRNKHKMFFCCLLSMIIMYSHARSCTIMYHALRMYHALLIYHALLMYIFTLFMFFSILLPLVSMC